MLLLPQVPLQLFGAPGGLVGVGVGVGVAVAQVQLEAPVQEVFLQFPVDAPEAM